MNYLMEKHSSKICLVERHTIRKGSSKIMFKSIHQNVSRLKLFVKRASNKWFFKKVIYTYGFYKHSLIKQNFSTSKLKYKQVTLILPGNMQPRATRSAYDM